MDPSPALIEAVPAEYDPNNPPCCIYCSVPTGNWCEGMNCEARRQSGLPARWICHGCETHFRVCRYCLPSRCDSITLDDYAHKIVITPGANTLCAKCSFHRGVLKVCGKCHIAKYCGLHCQKADWRRHKRYCAGFLQNNKGEHSNGQGGPASGSLPMGH